MFRTVTAILFAVAYLILGIPVLGIEWLIGVKNPQKRDLSSLRMVQWALRTIYKICGVHLTVIGLDRIPADTAVLYAANHNSYFDIIISYSLCPGLTGYIAKDSLKKVPLLRAWMRRLYCLFLNRSDPKQSLKTILTASEQIRRGISMCIFPEGTRGDNDTVLPFQEGSMRIASRTGCPIIPLAISNSRAVIADHMPAVEPCHIVLEYGKPIYPKELPRELQKELGKYTRSVIVDMLEKNRDLI